MNVVSGAILINALNQDIEGRRVDDCAQFTSGHKQLTPPTRAFNPSSDFMIFAGATNSTEQIVEDPV